MRYIQSNFRKLVALDKSAIEASCIKVAVIINGVSGIKTWSRADYRDFLNTLCCPFVRLFPQDNFLDYSHMTYKQADETKQISFK